jgi:hypothetical protein
MGLRILGEPDVDSDIWTTDRQPVRKWLHEGCAIVNLWGFSHIVMQREQRPLGETVPS